ncbi:FliM/FliN family flagellar motor switch protein [Rhodovulum marinum]|uniref:Type III flagellar switch regulator (C-ring) FliN n=1 Tax=Rhodovulum marinum TaxID=320662 RepID=A0A4V2SQ86_9RHOB|nr:FliM/FliN family flagellar motor switch protein [Rhodovulum marinum]TCP38046.1 type III flagellar switch regulator (C-ring) FliN [Rhodovulum marinum]
MTDDAHRAILRQIVGEGRVAMPDGAALASGTDGRFALRLEAARTVRDDFGLTGVVEECQALHPRLEDLEQEVTRERLAVLLQGGNGRQGLAVYSPELALALLEWRLLGMLSAEAPEARPLTATDAAILADLTDPLLTRFGAAMAARPGCDWAVGYMQGATVEDPRHVPLILPSGGYHGFRITLRLGEAGRGGELFLAVPETHAPAPPKPRKEEGPPWPDALKVGVLGAELVLNAVLWRTRLPAAVVGRLKPGDLLPMPATALTEVRLEAPGRVTVAEGRLGQSNGERAIKIDGEDGVLAGFAAPAQAAPGLAAPAPMALAEADLAEPEELALPGAAAFDAEATDFDPAAAFPVESGEFDPEAAFSPESADFGADFPGLAEG